MRVRRFLCAAMALLVFAVAPVYAAEAPQDAPTVDEVKPLHLEDRGLSVSLNGDSFTATGYTDAFDNHSTTGVSVRFRVYKQNSRGGWSLVKSSKEYYKSGTYVSATWQSGSLSSGVYEVRAEHYGYLISGGWDREISIYPMCFTIP